MAERVQPGSHRYEFEIGQEEEGTVYYDGAVIEVSTDDGANWEDVSTWASPSYGGTLTDVSLNPLALRPAYVDTNPAWPEFETAMRR